MKQKKFKVDDKVFAKVKGYPAWPAIITEVKKSTYSVRFYGTAEVGACKPQDLFYYLKYREKFTKNQKRKEFLDAVKEIDLVIAQCGGLDGSIDNSNTTTSNSDVSFSSSVDEVVSKKRGLESKTIQPRKKPNIIGSRSRRSRADEHVHASSPSRECTPEAESRTNSSNHLPQQECENMEVRLTIADIKLVTADYLNTVIAYAEHVRKNPETYQNLPEELRYNKRNELILVKTKSGNLVGIKYNRDKNENCKNEYQRAMYDEAEAKTMLSMKKLLENGQCLPEDDLSVFETNLDITDTQIQESIELALIESKKQKLEWLKVENKLAELDTEVKKHLGLDQANPEIAARLLEEILGLKIEPLMLLKHPSVFDMAKRLRRYVGNVHEWNYTEDECELFDALAGKVRDNADLVYKKFVGVLQYTGQDDPWDYYLEQVARFKEQVIDMVECNVFALTAPPTSRATFFDNMEDEEELKAMVDKLGKNKMTSTAHLHL